MESPSRKPLGKSPATAPGAPAGAPTATSASPGAAATAASVTPPPPAPPAEASADDALKLAAARRAGAMRLMTIFLVLGAGLAIYGYATDSDAYAWTGAAIMGVGVFAGYVGTRRRTGPKVTRPLRVHPYATEVSTPAEMAHDARNVALFWLALATGMTLIGLFLAKLFSPLLGGEAATVEWEIWTDIPLFAGLALLGFGFVDRAWAKSVTMAGWLLFGFYWALVAQDLFVAENGDYVNLFFAIVGVYFFTYLAYHQWLSEVRRVENHTVRFLNVSTFIAAGAYFVIDKVEPIRKWLIITVSDHTAWMLQLFGQGTQNDLRYILNPNGSTSDLPDPTQQPIASFHYTDHINTCPTPPSDWFGNIMHWIPAGPDVSACVTGLIPPHPHEVIPVSIILACTALQSIMLFVGLFMGTGASWRKRLIASAIVAVVVYVLNLVRNTGIIWFYGQGEASFWMMHDLVGKGGSLVAMVAIAFASFAWFPEFLKELVGVLDLYHRDGPVERAMKIGRRRPGQGPAAPPAV